MRAVMTKAKGQMEVVDVPEPEAPGPGEVIVRPEAVGICGSDFHYFLGEFDFPDMFPRVQGHEVCARVEELGPDCPEDLRVGERVALWPLQTCGQCYPCRIGRENACAQLRIIGVHTDGAFQERLRLPARQVFPVGDQDAEVTALVEPVSVGVRTAARGRIAEGEHVVVLGGGPIGQTVCLAAVDRGASVLLVDPFESRLELAKETGAEVVVRGKASEVMDIVRDWAGGDGPEVVVEATGHPDAARAAVEMVAPCGRVAAAGLSDKEVTIPLALFALKEIDYIGSSCMASSEFAAAIDLVARNRAAVQRLITHEFPLEAMPKGFAYAMEHPRDVLKAIVRLDG